ncbi:MAG: glutathione S-transferase family protein [Solirubrobacteraceae bacterium]
MPAPRLWSWNLSPFAGKVRVAFAEKGVAIELIEIDPLQRPKRLRELNPTNRVPVLELDGTAVRESTAICEWLEDTHPDPPLWPADPAARATARGLLRWVDDELTANFFLAMRKEAFGLDDEDHRDLVTTLRTRLQRRWGTVEQLLSHSDGPWLLAGQVPTLADLAATPLAVRLPAWKPDLVPAADAFPRVDAWLSRLRDRPSSVAVDARGTPAGDQ